MKRWKDAAGLAARSWRPLARFEALYKMAAVLLFVPLLLGSLSLIMRLRGYAYLTHESIGSFLTDPLTVLAAVLVLILGAAYVMTDIGAVAFALDQSAQGAAVTEGQILRFALKNTARAFRRKNALITPVALLLLPLANIGLAVGFLTAVSVPRAIVRYVRARPFLPPLSAAALIVMTALAIHWRYAVFYFSTEGCSFAEARRKSAALGRGKRLRDLAVLLAVQTASGAACVVLLLLATALARLFGALYARINPLQWLGSSAVWLAIVLTLAVTASLAVPVGYGCVGVLYYRRKAQTGAPEVHVPAPPQTGDRRDRKRRRLLRYGGVCVLAAGSVTVGFLLSTGAINPDIEHLHTMEITAHRGASAFYPENTMAAFAGAVELGADWIELDVQQCADGQLIVAHDANLKRTTGRNANVWELTYDEIAKLDAGSFFSREFAGERIPLLSEALEFARENDVRLNIELKPTGHETALEQRVVDAIRAAELEDSCVVTSQVYGTLEAVKAYDETIPTVYVMRLAYGSIDRLSAADCFSVEAKSVTRALVSRVHNAGKSLYVWTVNSRQSIMRMIELSVDNIITDNIDLAKQCVYESRYNDLLEEYTELIP